jgi:D-sedoheptulose 7-phosphate isomerase|tara:strand:- start:767 stop:1363 length:597 start_codon:yes stop_codon:yes gene_type:complete
MTLENIKASVQASIDTKIALLNDDALLQQVSSLAERCTSALRAGGKIIFCGNGGSFADAQHLSAEFTSRFLFDRPGLPSLALGTNSSAMTAIGNDYGYENVFAREIEAIATPADVLIAITTSGNSVNILKALEAAKETNVPSVVLTGAGRGMLDAATEALNIPSTDTARIQECHILLGHIICGLVEESIFGSLRAENA